MATFRAPVVIAIIGAIGAAVAAFLYFSPPGPPADLLLSDGADLLPKELGVVAGSIAKSEAQPMKPSVAPTPSTPGPTPSAQSGEVKLTIFTPPLPGTRKPRYQPGPSKFRDATDPRARIALARVGADFDAETYWLSAINDPRTPAAERKDLIEDLNEDGISDPARPSRQDLPLITSRIELIERLLPSAKDKVNADAFREAHKDLMKMRDRLLE